MGSIKIVKAPVSSDPENRRLQLLGLVVHVSSGDVSAAHTGTVTVPLKAVVTEFNKIKKVTAAEYWGSIARESLILQAGEYEIIS